MLKLKVNTDQEAFDMAYSAIVEQGCASVDNMDVCSYRGKNNTACPIGHLLECDEEERGNLDRSSLNGTSYGIEGLVNREIVDNGNVNVSLLVDIQRAHDISAPKKLFSRNFVTRFRKRMMEVAKYRQLSVNIMNQ